MKTIRILLVVAFATFALPACKTGPALSQGTSTAVVVNAEKTLSSARNTIETFLQLEHNHRAFIKKNLPAVHAGAESIRRRYVDAMLVADNAKNAVKYNLTATGQADLNTAIQTIVQLASEAQNYTKQINNSTP